MKGLIIGLVLFISASGASAYEGHPKEQVAQFFKDLSSDKTTQAVDNLYSSNPVMSQKIQQLSLLKQQLGAVSTLYGKIIGTENVHYEELSPSLIRIVEIAKHELHPVAWEFYFYKPSKSWIISQGIFADQFQVLGKKK